VSELKRSAEEMSFTAYLFVLNTVMASLPVLWWGTKSIPLALVSIVVMVGLQHAVRRWIDPDRGAPSPSAPTPRRFAWMLVSFGIFVAHVALFARFLAVALPSGARI
jgi:hypothetical protein